MYAFLDEAGDTGLKVKKGSSRFFTISLVIFTDGAEMQACDQRISALRKELGKHQNFEFHFHDNNPKVREAFLSAVSPFGFMYYAFVLNKDPDKLWGDVFKDRESFYKTVCKFIFENARQHLRDAYVIIDKSGSRDFQAALAKYVKGMLNTDSEKIIRKFRAERSSQNNLIQLADYIASIYHRKALNKKDAEHYRRSLALKEIQFRKWP
ncbi:DUF3800 domain-containing protein [Candidatus Uhrbacteria bacterium]|nr:DUF3800 domain-containing protein [Candidatus Uhrbacteria bacterium]